MFESSVRSLQCLSPYTPPPPRSLRQIKQRKRTPLATVFGSLDREKSPKMFHFIQQELETLEKEDITYELLTKLQIKVTAKVKKFNFPPYSSHRTLTI
ncbi:hypothetical protein AVEN_222783-1 [Araneus ventricosus]|uniref:Uncharacterized protein n=1 Tax=Araneus ventricosus TaxID=182803 RepID=A0A4Y2B1K4_ARAVE|nr:hypothetical protein AVEN_222783-1 [Araneus ventricosus]